MQDTVVPPASVYACRSFVEVEVYTVPELAKHFRFPLPFQGDQRERGKGLALLAYMALARVVLDFAWSPTIECLSRSQRRV